MSRRDQIRMTEDEMVAFIEEQKTITLVSNGAGGFPHPMPMWFTADDDLIVSMATFRGTQKIVNLQRDPRVSLLVEAGRGYSELKGVVIYGSADLSDDTAAFIATLKAASQKETTEIGAETQIVMDEGMKKSAAKRILIRVKPDRIVSWDHSKLQGIY